MGVSKINGTPKSSIPNGFSILNHPFWGTPIFGNIHIVNVFQALASPAFGGGTEGTGALFFTRSQDVP